MRTTEELAQMIHDLRAQCRKICLETMTPRIEKKLHRKCLQLLQRSETMDEVEWCNFLETLPRGDQKFVQAFFPQICHRLERLVQDQPLGASIRANRGHWPTPQGWHLPTW